MSSAASHDDTRAQHTTDPFWYSVYRPLLLAELQERCSQTAAERLRSALAIHPYLEKALGTCTTLKGGGGRRSDLVGYLFTVKQHFSGDLGDRTNDAAHTLFDDSREHLEFLMGVLKDVTGRQPLDDLTFVPSLRETFHGPDKQEFERFIFNTLYHLKIREDTTHAPSQEALRQTFSGRDGGTIAKATYSSHALARWYKHAQWQNMQHIPMSSRVALCYRWYDPLQVLPGNRHGYVRRKETQDQQPTAALLSNLLTPFAKPVDTDFLDMVLPRAGFDNGSMGTTATCRRSSGLDTIRLCIVVTTCEIALPSEDQPTPHGLREVNVDAVSNRDICIRVGEWLDTSEHETFLRDPEEAWIVPGWQLSYEEYAPAHGELLGRLGEFHLIEPPRGWPPQFRPRWGGMLVDKQTARCIRNQVIRQISEQIDATTTREPAQ